MPYRFRLARPADDPALRGLLRALPVEGSIRLRFEREPSYFAASLPGEQTLVAESPEGQLVGVATRGVRTVFVNGVPTEVGYLGQLRVHPAHQGRWLVAGGFSLLRKLHADGRCTGYLTTITSGNRLAEGVLVGRARARFPRYHRLAEVHTFTYPLRRPYPLRAQAAALPAVHDRPQFFPAVQRGTRFWRLDDDASAALVVPTGRQIVVAGYDRWLGAVRPLAGLPAPGAALRLGYAAYLWARTPRAFARLLESLLEVARRQGLDYLSLGLCAGHPHLAAAAALPHRLYRSVLHWAGWEPPPPLDGRPVFVEVALL